MAFMSMVVNLFDSASIVISSVVLLFLKPDMDAILRGMWYIGTATSILYLLIVPESPRWEFMLDSNSQEGIKIVNYIAWFNGSKFRVPSTANMDQVGQVIEENETMNQTDIARLRFQINTQI
jgi:hypothetical protein